MAPRIRHRVTVTVEETGKVMAEAETMAHNSAMRAGVDHLREHARMYGGYYVKGDVVAPASWGAAPTVVRWTRRVTHPRQGEAFDVLITVERVA